MIFILSPKHEIIIQKHIKTVHLLLTLNLIYLHTILATHPLFSLQSERPTTKFVDKAPGYLRQQYVA